MGRERMGWNFAGEQAHLGERGVGAELRRGLRAALRRGGGRVGLRGGGARPRPLGGGAAAMGRLRRVAHVVWSGGRESIVRE